MRLRGAAFAGVMAIVGSLVFGSEVSGFVNENIVLQGQEFQIAISPASVEYDLVPGQTTKESIQVRNVGSMETDLRIGIDALTLSGETTLLGTPRNEIVDWTSVTLRPGCEATRVDAATGDIYVHMRVKEECHVEFATKTPANAPFGEQYMSVFFEEVKNGDTSSVQSVRSIGANVYGTNRTGDGSGASDICGEVINQSVPFWLFEGPLRTSAEIENCGRLNFHATVRIEVYNLFGGLVYEESHAQDRIVAAESTRKIEDVWNEARIGIFKVKQTVEALGETYVVEKMTFIVPVWLLVLILGCLLVAVLAYVHDRKKKRGGRRRNG